MPLTVPTTIFSSEERFVNVVREATPGTIPASSGTTFPIVNFEPEDKLLKLPDEGLRGAMGKTYGIQFGPRYAEASIGGPVFADMIGHELYNMLGDYTQSATAATPNTTLTSSPAVGATTLNVTSGTSFTVNMWIQVDTGLLSEIVQVLSSTTNTITLQTTTPIRIPGHSASATVTNTTIASAGYNNIFSLLNSTNNPATAPPGFGQPITHTYTDRTLVPATGLARQYAYSCFSELTFTGNAEKLTEWNGAFSAFAGQIAASAPSPSISTATVWPDFNTLFGLNGVVSGAPIYDISEWSISMSRKVEPYFTNSGSFNPYVIARGPLVVTGKLTFAPAVDETALLYLLNNTQPQIQIQAFNGLTGANKAGLQFDIVLGAFDTSKINASRSLFGYDVTFEAVSTNLTANSVTTIGWSAGYSPIKVTLVNTTPIY